MKTRVLCIIAAAALALSVSTTAAASGEASPKPAADAERPKAAASTKETANGHAAGSQQNKMKHCNEEAKKKELKGDERRAFMSTCLKG